jgi:D-glycero-beta-D-manno-heptose-7-phosphate kinase
MTTEPILIVGDSMLDRYWTGVVERISPEAPVPVLRLLDQSCRAGGAANVALNLARLQCQVTLATLLGRDEAGDELEGLLRHELRLQAVRAEGVTTTQKIRSVCRQEQLLRVDIEAQPPEACVQALTDLSIDLFGSHHWVLLSDYAKGCLRHCEALIRRANAAGCRVLVDPKGRDFTRYEGAWLLKPNEPETQAVVGRWRDEADFRLRAEGLRTRLHVEHLLVTRGERGMTLFSAGAPAFHVDAELREVYDVCGAGDTVLAALGCLLARGESLHDAVRLANRAAGIVVGRFGTATVSPEELGLA